MHTFVSQIISDNHEKSAQYLNQKRHLIQYHAGDTVCLKNHVIPSKAGTSAKFRQKWIPNFIITEICSPVTVRLYNITTHKALPSKINIERIQHCNVRSPDSDEYFTSATKPSNESSLSAHHPNTSNLAALSYLDNDPHHTKTLPPTIARLAFKKYTQSNGWEYRVVFLNLPNSHNVWVKFDNLPPKLQLLAKTTHSTIPLKKRPVHLKPITVDQVALIRTTDILHGTDEHNSPVNHLHEQRALVSLDSELTPSNYHESDHMDPDLLEFTTKVRRSQSMLHLSRSSISKRLFNPITRAKFAHLRSKYTLPENTIIPSM
jgi:hypothetical protein